MIGFPRSKIKAEKIKVDVKNLKRNWNKKDKVPFGSLITKPNSLAVFSQKELLESNYNNIGFIFSNKDKVHDVNLLGEEKKTISLICNLLNGNNCAGYVNSGGTESNFMGLFHGCQNFGNRKEILVLVTSLTHYSVIKAAKFLNISIRQIPLNNQFTMDIKKLEQFLENTNKKIIIVGTLGYSTTGNCDNIKEINKICRRFCKKVYLHIDAAYGGFVVPFTNPKFKWDFSLDQVKSIAIDAHKTLGVPYPAGVFISRKNNFLYNKIDYTGQLDVTFLGSRSGHSAVAINSVIFSTGMEGLSKILLRCIQNKNLFIKKMSLEKDSFIDGNFLPTIAIKASFLGNLNKEIKEKYSLHKSKIQDVEFYSFHFMPFLQKKMINMLVTDLKRNSHGI
jgi:tyrosine decarboxylase / aspartate 1-decarboxylase